MWASIGGLGIEVVAFQSWANNTPRSARRLESLDGHGIHLATESYGLFV